MDEELTIHELGRLEAERKLRDIPGEVLTVAWVREAQVEAVLDAVLAVSCGGSAGAEAHARHVGEWSARIAAALPYGPDPAVARRTAVLADLDPTALERIPELQHLARHIADYQHFAMGAADGEPRVLSLVIAVATEFDARIGGEGRSPASALRSMLREANGSTRAIVKALAQTFETRSGLARCSDSVP